MRGAENDESVNVSFPHCQCEVFVIKITFSKINKLILQSIYVDI
jgi:hypothetical protein